MTKKAQKHEFPKTEYELLRTSVLAICKLMDARFDELRHVLDSATNAKRNPAASKEADYPDRLAKAVGNLQKGQNLFSMLAFALDPTEEERPNRRSRTGRR